MAQEFDNTNTFIIGKNDKGDNEKRPDYRGSAIVRISDLIADENGCATIDMSGWIRTKQSDGSKFISGTVQQRQPKAGQAPAKKPTPVQQPIADDDSIPF